MNTFFEVVAILLLVFLFIGEPDVWDNLHERAMNYTACNTTSNITKGESK